MASDALKLAQWVINHEDGRVECKRCDHRIDLSPTAASREGNAYVFNNNVWFSIGWLLQAIVQDGHDCFR